MLVFPVGTINSSDSTGTLNDSTYTLWEPNNGCHVSRIYHNIVEKFEAGIITTRQKAEPLLTITYNYDNIFHKEYKQIEHFVRHRKAELHSFYTIDWSSGYTPDSVASLVSGRWKITIDSTLDYSATGNMKSNFGILWNGSAFRIGQIYSVNTATSVDMLLQYGNLSLTKAQTESNFYPIYNVYFTQNPLSGFQPTVYIGGDLSNTDFAGYMRSGTVSFITKYKVR